MDCNKVAVCLVKSNKKQNLFYNDQKKNTLYSFSFGAYAKPKFIGRLNVKYKFTNVNITRCIQAQCQTRCWNQNNEKLSRCWREAIKNIYRKKLARVGARERGKRDKNWRSWMSLKLDKTLL